jgi:hypothetical protein
MPVGNNTSEIWSQFGFLMPGLLDDRRGWAKRIRTARYGQPNVEPLRDRNGEFAGSDRCRREEAGGNGGWGQLGHLCQCKPWELVLLRAKQIIHIRSARYRTLGGSQAV